MNSPRRRPLALIAGPTASGKTALALSLAERHGGVIVNADASQVYRDLRILSARPDAAETARAPHRLFGHVDGAVAHDAARWAGEAKAVLAAIWDEGRLPILVGGTGLYIRTLLDGIAPVPEIDPAIRADVRALSTPEARAALEREDAAAAAGLAPRDTARTMRALEVVRGTGRSILDWRADRTGGIGGMVDLSATVLDPPVEALYDRCDRRVDAMLRDGGIDEVCRLAGRGLDPALPVMRAIGVPPLLGHLAGAMTLAEAAALMKQQTRHYAKRQRTWARHQFPADWPRIAGPVVVPIPNITQHRG